MSESENSGKQNMFGNITGVVTLLTAALFFTGWIYRWAYFSYFQVDLTGLILPFQSFVILPIQIFFGSFGRIFKTIGVILVTIVVIDLILWGLRDVEKWLSKLITKPSTSKRPFPLSSESNPLKLGSLTSLASFLNEIVTVVLLLIVLFWCSRWAGLADAQRDAYHCTSVLPRITFVSSLEKNPLGSPLDPPFQEFKKFGVIGDDVMLKRLYNKFLNETDPLDPVRVWRLLLEDNKWIYLFPALPPESKPNLHPPVVAMQKSSGEQAMILIPPLQDKACKP